MKKPLFLIVVLLMAISCTNQNDPTTAIPTDAKPIALKAGMEKRGAQSPLAELQHAPSRACHGEYRQDARGGPREWAGIQTDAAIGAR